MLKFSAVAKQRGFKYEVGSKKGSQASRENSAEKNNVDSIVIKGSQDSSLHI
jgi:hypothetical protein